MHHLLMIFGIGAIVLLGMMFIKPDLLEKFKQLSPFTVAGQDAEEDTAPPSLAMLMATPEQVAQSDQATAKPTELTEEDRKMLGNQRQQQWVTNWLAKRYRIASDATNMLVSASYLTAKEIKLDPLLILSVMAIESGLNPFAESPVGAQGLMQVMSKLHHEKFQEMGGIKAALNPVANIKVGALILKDYVSRGGSVEAGLKLYVGAAAFENDAGYGSRVLAEYRRLKDVANGKNIPTFNAPAPIPVAPPARHIENIATKVDAVTETKAAEQKPAHPEQIAKL
ncbi:lytic transglycosylase domain-containing protein [Undibacterium sp. RTI2.1]|nr:MULTISPECIES: lytic transglycosylase domain-containing protein [unclassified Undibacterium]MDY7538085.1 lytic transglycosylase domain-containing protein [Undibacterium sp. 5I1]MEB0032477.1 lytic transglycosylase domain-containing protein [Undibacterium sp. RTI2.1]MEB0118509.1 lytic transglycosylase domain-containing protein [Undibacterium sp. RTI2.2]MEB0232251.1 lytic transglycosylase domain-containing protein [Undibacterium sp. 10I3]MEB0259482.1 lytic transglycosylase domain-containing pro